MAVRYKSITLDLGHWSIRTITDIIDQCQTLEDPNVRIAFLMKQFTGVPFCFESNLPWPDKGELCVRFATMDCLTYVYHLMALARSRNFDEFLSNICDLRYAGEGMIDSHPDTGNIYNFACESLLQHAVKRGLLEDRTRQILDEHHLMSVTVELKRTRRPLLIDKGQHFIGTRLGDGPITELFIPVQCLHLLNIEEIRTGDVIVFTGGPLQRNGEPAVSLVSHLGFAYREGQELFLSHATKHFYWRPFADASTPASCTGIYYDGERKKEQIGTGIAGIFAGDDTKTMIDGMPYFGMNQAIKRPVADYAKYSFAGVKFLRPL